MKNIILASTSTVHGSNFLEYLLDDLKELYSDTGKILFIPYARPNGISYEDYTELVSKAFAKIGINVKGIHEYNDPIAAIQYARGIFVGGGNTFVLVNELYKNDLIPILRSVINAGIPYLGTSAGSNICGLTLCTTNDMPIVYPPSFETLGMVPFNINPHYLDPNPESKHMGETRETRINEFHKFNSIPVIGLREGSLIRVFNNKIVLKGTLNARIFEQNNPPYEIAPESDITELNKL